MRTFNILLYLDKGCDILCIKWDFGGAWKQFCWMLFLTHIVACGNWVKVRNLSTEPRLLVSKNYRLWFQITRNICDMKLPSVFVARQHADCVMSFTISVCLLVCHVVIFYVNKCTCRQKLWTVWQEHHSLQNPRGNADSGSIKYFGQEEFAFCSFHPKSPFISATVWYRSVDH